MCQYKNSTEQGGKCGKVKMQLIKLLGELLAIQAGFPGMRGSENRSSSP